VVLLARRGRRRRARRAADQGRDQASLPPRPGARPACGSAASARAARRQGRARRAGHERRAGQHRPLSCAQSVSLHRFGRRPSNMLSFCQRRSTDCACSAPPRPRGPCACRHRRAAWPRPPAPRARRSAWRRASGRPAWPSRSRWRRCGSCAGWWPRAPVRGPRRARRAVPGALADPAQPSESALPSLPVQRRRDAAAAPRPRPTGPRLPGRHGCQASARGASGAPPYAAARSCGGAPACRAPAGAHKGGRLRTGTLGAFEAAEVALRLLHALVAGQAAADVGGRPLLPLPRARRELAAPASLPHLAQARPAAPCRRRPRIAHGAGPGSPAAPLPTSQAAASAGAAALCRGRGRVPALHTSGSGPRRRQRPRGALEASRRGPARLGLPAGMRHCATLP